MQGRWKVPRRGAREGGGSEHRASGPSPHRAPTKAATGPTSQTRVVRESPSQPRHKRRVHGAHAQIGPGSQRLSSLSRAQAPPPRSRGPELRGRKTRMKGGQSPRLGLSQGRLANLQGWPGHPPASRKPLERSERPREPGPPSAGGTWAPGTARRGCACMFVQRRLHLATSLISGCGLR